MGFLRRLAQNPRAFFLSEAASVSGAATARTGAPETPGAQLGAGLAGGIGPSVVTGVGRGTVRVGKRLGRAWGSETRRAELGKELAAAELQKEVVNTEHALAGLERAAIIMEEVPGSKFTFAQATGVPEMLQFEATQAYGRPALAMDLLLVREAGQAAPIRALAKHAGVDVPATEARKTIRATEWQHKEAVDAVIEARANTTAMAMETAIEAAQRRVREAVDNLTSGLEPEEIAEVTRKTIQDEAEGVFKPLRQGYDEMDNASDTMGINKGPATVDASPIRRAWAELRRKATHAEGTGLDKNTEDTLRWISEVDEETKVLVRPEIPFRELRGLSKHINAWSADATTAVERNQRRLAHDLRKSINETLDAVDSSTKYPILAERKRTLDAQWGAASEKWHKGMTGRFVPEREGAPAASATLDLYFKKGRKTGAPEAADEFHRVADAATEQMMEDYIITSAWRSVTSPEGGKAKNLKEFLDAYGPALRKFPEARAKIRSLRTLQESADNLGLEKTQTLDEYQKSVVGLFAKKKATEAVTAVIRADNPHGAAQALKKELRGNPDALAGAARLFWGQLLARSYRYGDLGLGTAHYFEPQTLARLVDDFEPAIRELQGPEHVARLRNYYFPAAEMAFKGRIPRTARNIQRTAGTGVSPYPLIAPIYSKRQRAVRIAIQAAKALKNLDFGARQAAMDEGLRNAKFGKELLTMPAGSGAVWLRRIRSNLITLGVRTPEPEED
jgi:hypothetical protein